VTRETIYHSLWQEAPRECDRSQCVVSRQQERVCLPPSARKHLSNQARYERQSQNLPQNLFPLVLESLAEFRGFWKWSVGMEEGSNDLSLEADCMVGKQVVRWGP
jgi:hypothetical protein